MKKPPTSMPRGAARGRIRSGQWAGGLRSCQCEHRLKTPKSGRAGGRQSGLHLATCTLGLNPHRRDAVPPAWGLRRRIFPRELSLRLFSLRGLLTGRTRSWETPPPPPHFLLPPWLPLPHPHPSPPTATIPTLHNPAARPKPPRPGADTSTAVPASPSGATPPAAGLPRRALRACASRRALCHAPSRYARPRHTPPL